MSKILFQHESEVVAPLVREAGRIVMAHYQTEFTVTTKSDSSPVTMADLDANGLIVESLTAAFPKDSIISEESPTTGKKNSERKWLVDPLDGTREFVDKNGMFVIMIGLAIKGEAVFGAIYQPTEDLFMMGAKNFLSIQQGGKNLTPNLSQTTQGKDSVFVVSRSHPSKSVERVAKKLESKDVVRIGSVGLKIAQIVTGKGDVYLSTSNKMSEWDTCAPEAILRAAGGTVSDITGAPLRYGKESPNTMRGIIASNGLLHHQVVDACREIVREKKW